MSLMKNAFVGAVVLISALVGSGCASQAAKTLGSLPVVMTRTPPSGSTDTFESQITIGCCETPLATIYRVNLDGDVVTSASTDNGIYRIADVSALEKNFFLGVAVGNPHLATPAADAKADAPPSLLLEPPIESQLKARRAIVAMRLIEIADLNGAEYWRRFSALMEYKKAFDAGEKSLLGAGIASAFISPVLSASLTGASATIDATTSSLTAGFNIETYTALRDAVRKEVVRRRGEIRARLANRSYLDYPIGAVLADVSDYAHVYSIRGAVDTMKAALAEAAKNAEKEAQKELDSKK